MTRYAVLLEAEVLHDYLLNRGDTVFEALNDGQQAQLMQQFNHEAFLSIAPTAQTRRTLSGHKMIFKTTAAGFLVAVKTDDAAPDVRPAIPLAADFRLSFALRVTDPRFFNYTALTAEAAAIYYFNNRSGNEAAGSRFLSAAVPAFNAARAYEADELYSESSGGVINLFRALRDTGPSAIPLAADWSRIPADTFDAAATYTEGSVLLAANRLYRALIDGPGNDLTNATEWEMFATLANQYVSTADRLPAKPPLFNVDVSGAALPQITVRLRRAGETSTVWEQSYQAPTGNLENLQIDARALAPGVYQLIVLDGALTELPVFGFSFYLDGAAINDNWFGVIEIGLGSGGLALLDGSGALRSPRYTLRFLNRATRWRYIFPADQALGSGAEVAPEGADNRILVTAQPRPLTRFGTGLRLQADDELSETISEEVLLPEPETNRIRRQNAQWYSEIHMSNLPL
ncbi:MAG TPA: hypothetical protein VIM41_11915 [Gammaproteobacteria bacterium]